MPGARTARFSFTERPIDWPLDALASGVHAQQVGARALTWLRQEHGSRVVTVSELGQYVGAVADAAVTNVVGVQLLIRTADCAPIALRGVDHDGSPVIGVVHAGWQGLLRGVIGAAVSSLEELGAQKLRASIGPCIGVECYEFGPQPLQHLVDQFGETLRGTTTWGTPGLNMIEASRIALAQAGVADVQLSEGWGCTACNAARFYSHRARQDTGRLGLVAEVVADA